MKKKNLVLIILGLSFWGGLFLNGSYCWGAARGKAAFVNGNFLGISQETIDNWYSYVDSYNATSDNPTDPVNTAMYPDEDIDKFFYKNAHGTIVYKFFEKEIESLGVEKPEILLVKTADPNSDGIGNTKYIAKGIRAAADWGADVINISMSAGYKTNPDVEAALKYAKEKGSIVVVASGNQGGEDMRLTYPASSKYSIAVGAHDAAGHPTIYTSGVGDDKLDFTAKVDPEDEQNREILYEFLGLDQFGLKIEDVYKGIEGTSNAAPIVAADAYMLKKYGDSSIYDLDGDGKLSQEEVIMGLNDEAGKKFKNISSITYDRSEILRQRYGFLKGGYQRSFADDPGVRMEGLYYDPEKEENYIEGYYLNSGRFNEFFDALDDISFEEQEYCYKSHAFQLCGFESLALCESMMPQDVGGCGKIGDMVNTQDGLEGILAADIDGDGIPDGETYGNFWDDLLGGGEPNADSGEENNTGADGCAAGFAMENGICIPSSSGLHSPVGANPLLEVLRRVMLWLLGVIGFIAIVAFVISGIQYLISAGDQNMIETAKRNMKWSIVGVVTALSGLIILQFIYIMMS